VGPTLAEIARELDKPFCLVVDGRSTDGTVKIAEAMGATVITQRGLGKGDAIATAIARILERKNTLNYGSSTRRSIIPSVLDSSSCNSIAILTSNGQPQREQKPLVGELTS
jgi:glycosyltransferase involved in cell wall biosynthesis